MKIFELQNQGKGIITSLLPEQLLLIVGDLPRTYSSTGGYLTGVSNVTSQSHEGLSYTAIDDVVTLIINMIIKPTTSGVLTKVLTYLPINKQYNMKTMGTGTLRDDTGNFCPVLVETTSDGSAEISFKPESDLEYKGTVIIMYDTKV